MMFDDGEGEDGGAEDKSPAGKSLVSSTKGSRGSSRKSHRRSGGAMSRKRKLLGSSSRPTTAAIQAGVVAQSLVTKGDLEDLALMFRDLEVAVSGIEFLQV